jgi:NTE family protein
MSGTTLAAGAFAGRVQTGTAVNSTRIFAEPQIAVIFAGGVGLGAYEAGAYAALHGEGRLLPTWFAGSSVGAVNAALIVGNPAERRIDVLQRFWRAAPFPPAAGHVAAMWRPWRHMHNWLSVMETRLLGSPGHFRPRVLPNPYRRFSSLYDLSPLRASLEKFVDIERLNSGEIRLSVAATDIESGDLVVFDTARNDRIEIDHLLASCGFLPEFAPVEIGGRLLGDGGLVANAPLEAVLGQAQGDLLCFVVDVYPRDGARPVDLETAFARKEDLVFGNQTYMRLQALAREGALRARIAQLAERMPPKTRRDPLVASALAEGRAGRTAVFYLSYRAPPEEAGSEKSFDLSPTTIAARWRAGALDMEAAIEEARQASTAGEEPFVVRTIRRPPDLAVAPPVAPAARHGTASPHKAPPSPGRVGASGTRAANSLG